MIKVICVGNCCECKTENEARRRAEIASRFDEVSAFVWVDGEIIAEYIDGEEVAEDGDDDGCDVYEELYDDEIGYNPYMGCYDMDV